MCGKRPLAACMCAQHTKNFSSMHACITSAASDFMYRHMAYYYYVSVLHLYICIYSVTVILALGLGFDIIVG